MIKKELRETDFSKEKLKSIMQLRGYSQRQLERMTNISQAQISTYLRGVCLPSKKTVEKFAQELCVDVEDLLNNSKTENEYQDIIDIAQEIGNIRYKLIQMIQEVDEEAFNAQDQNFLHAVENIEDIKNMTGEEALEILTKEHYSRKNRRNYKERKHLIQLLLNGFLIKNPPVYMMRVIEKSKDWTYIPRVAEKLKQDTGLYDLEREQRFLDKLAQKES